MKYEINPIFDLVFYDCDQGIHTMVYKSAATLTCRKCRIKELENFLDTKGETLFKGGLRLHSSRTHIEIIAKKEPIGKVPKRIFREAMTKVRGGELDYYKE